MSTLKQTIDVLNCPYLYTKKERRKAAKIAIDILDKMAESKNEPAVEADAESCGVCAFEFKTTGGKYCSNCGRKHRTA